MFYPFRRWRVKPCRVVFPLYTWALRGNYLLINLHLPAGSFQSFENFVNQTCSVKSLVRYVEEYFQSGKAAQAKVRRRHCSVSRNSMLPHNR